MAAAPRCLVWLPDEADELEIVLTGPAGVVKNLNRPRSELLEKPLQRLTLVFNPQPKKNKKAKTSATPTSPVATGAGETDGAPVTVNLLDAHGAPVPKTLPNSEAWVEGHVLQVGAVAYPVHVNVPRVRLQLPDHVFWVGCPVSAHVVESTGAHLSECMWTWRRIPRESAVTLNANTGDTCTTDDPSSVVQVGRERCYTPIADDVGHRLAVECVPVRAGPDARVEGQSFQCISSGVVAPFLVSDEELEPVRTRQQYTNKPLIAPELRVVSYNILADCYSNTDMAFTQLYPYCPKKFLNGFYRRALTLRELRGYNADILCLQEVGRTTYWQYLSIHLGESGFSGVLDEKAGKMAEGCATFWRKERFRKKMHRCIYIQDAIKRDEHASLAATLSRDSPAMLEVLQKVTTVGQMVLLEDTASGALVAVVNCHLFFHPNAPQVRAFQVHLLLTEVQHALQGLPTPAILFCGDLNAKPTNDLYSFVRTGKLESTALIWWKGRNFKWGKGEDFYDFLKSEEDRPVDSTDPVPGTYFCMDLTHPLPGLESIHVAVANAEPEYTNLVSGFEGVLDYIFFHPDQLKAIHALPVPPRALVKQNTGLPSPVFPSDHVAVVADLQLKAQGASE